MPVRSTIVDAADNGLTDAARTEICAAVKLDPALPVLLVFGGSQGARDFEQLLCDALQAPDAATGFQIIHLTGHDDNHDSRRNIWDCC